MKVMLDRNGESKGLPFCSLHPFMTLEKKDKESSKSTCPSSTQRLKKLKFTCSHTSKKDYASSQYNTQFGHQPHAEAVQSWKPALVEVYSELKVPSESPN